MTNPAITLVTVIFTGETNLLKLQARSIGLFVDPAFVDDIFIVLNDPESGPLNRLIKRSILPEYGPLKHKVRIINSRRLCKLPKYGWHGQQVLKLEIARRVKTPWYCVLDAKNHFLRSFGAPDFYGDDQRPWNFDARVSEEMTPARVVSLDQFGLMDGGKTQKHLPYITPFPLPTQEVVALLDYCKKEQKDTIAHIIIKKGATEFLLFDAWLQFRMIDFNKLYHIRNRKPLITFWRNSPRQGIAFQRLSRSVEYPEVYILSLHRELYGFMEDDFMDWVISIWLDRGIVTSQREAEAFLASPDLTI